MRRSANVAMTLVALAAVFCATPAGIGGASFQGLGDLPGGQVFSSAFAVSADGSVVVGASKSALSGSDYEAFRWTRIGGMIGLGDLPGAAFASVARGVSSDGLTVVGWGRTDLGTGGGIDALVVRYSSIAG